VHLLAYLATLVGLATLVVGIAPVLQAFRVSVVGGGTIGAPRAVGHRRWSARGVLITVQVAVSTILLVATTLFVRSLWVASRIDPGFDIGHVVTIEADTRSRQLTAAETDAFYRAAVDRLKGVPNVSAVSGAAIVPLSMDSIVHSLEVERGGRNQAMVNSNWILPDYFRVMGISLRSGRDLGQADVQAKPRAVIVNETFARLVFPGGSALGERVRRPAAKGQEEPWAEIVGVVADSRYLTLGEDTRPQVYWPFGPQLGKITLHVRTEGDATALAGALGAGLAGLDPRVRVRARPLQAVMAVALFPAQAAAVVLAALGLVGWALTVAGVYGLVAYAVTRRIPEIGVRVALGAPPWSVMRLLLRDGLVIAVVGVAAGLIVAACATPFLSALLAGVSPHDVPSFGLVAAALVLTALVASYGPARRGIRLSPTEALRSE
jgi:putative ABC transport system permease protein